MFVLIWVQLQYKKPRYLAIKQFTKSFCKKLFFSKYEPIRHKKAPKFRGFCGTDGTRTRDLRRDRAAF